MSPRRSKEEWLQDIAARQRNIVFPDTAQNEARFWRNLIEGKGRLTIVQAVGICVIALAVLVLLFCTLFLDGPFPGLSWGNLISGAFRWLIVLALLGGFLLVFTLSQRSNRK
jgi:hypothetical protein